MGEHVCLEKKNAPPPNSGCKWCGNREPPLSFYRISATQNGPWMGPFCNRMCLVNYYDERSWRDLNIKTVWR